VQDHDPSLFVGELVEQMREQLPQTAFVELIFLTRFQVGLGIEVVVGLGAMTVVSIAVVTGRDANGYVVDERGERRAFEALVEFAVDDEKHLLTHVVKVSVGHPQASQLAAHRPRVGHDDRSELGLGRTIAGRHRAVQRKPPPIGYCERDR